MDEVLQYIITTTKTLTAGELPNFPDPDDPEDLGEALTQDEIDTLKKFIKEIKHRYTDPEL